MNLFTSTTLAAIGIMMSVTAVYNIIENSDFLISLLFVIAGCGIALFGILSYKPKI